MNLRVDFPDRWDGVCANIFLVYLVIFDSN